jgi:X-Pro dipeptidyl-peptidase
MKKFLCYYLLLTTVAFVFSQVSPAQQNEPATIKSTPNAIKVPVVENGEVQKIPEFDKPEDWIREDLWVETTFDSDGDGRPDRMHVDVTRPKQTVNDGIKLPVIYESSPYFAGTGTNDKNVFWPVRQELNTVPVNHKEAPPIARTGKRPVISTSQLRWVPYGFIVVHSSAPGTGLSQGCPTVGTDIERFAPKAVIDWLNGRAKGYTTPDGTEEVKATWTTGKVGMIGTSYNGTIPFAAATTGVEGLEAIIPVAPNTSYYHYYRSNGLVRSPGGYLGEDVDVLYDFIFSNPDMRDYCNTNVRDKVILTGIDRVSGDYSDFWAKRDLMNYMKNFKAATLMAHGLNDWNVVPSHSIRFMKTIKEKGVPLQVYFHQGGHGGEPPFTLMNRWFTRYLFGIQNDVEKDPKAWIVRENDDRQKPTPYPDYPNPDAKDVKLFLTAGAPQSGGLVTTRPAPQGKETLVDNFSYSSTVLAQAEWTDNRLIYATPVLKQPVHLSGVSRITIKAASSKPAVNLSVYLIELPWNASASAKITDNLITRQWADLQNYKSLSKGEPLVPGKFYEMTFELEPDDQIIPAGRQIGLMIFSSDRDFTLRPDPGTKLTVDLDGTTITLPVVGGMAGIN